ncbi:chemotaxis protein CheW [Alteromonas sp. CYL-A6]|uniref:chemotaxis protein CheW n=1 Tax=Alteromonas nitratireducens TaxID=3390813 RepID=UPI0034B9D07C
MNKQSPFAREHIMQEYLDSLLRAPEDPAEVTARTAKLLEQATFRLAEVPELEQPVSTETVERVETVEAPAPVTTPVTEVVSETNVQPEKTAPEVAMPTQTVQEMLDEQFQALFFDVAGLTLAVPLITLGGIHQLEKVGPLFGKPDWFKGVMLHRDEKLNVVDTALWVMPEKYDQNLAETLHYQYLVMLGDSVWGLACEKLVNTVTLSKSDVKWRESKGKRPWLAGMVKERMCALIDVNQLVAMLSSGLGSNDQTK